MKFQLRWDCYKYILWECGDIQNSTRLCPKGLPLSLFLRRMATMKYMWMVKSNLDRVGGEREGEIVLKSFQCFHFGYLLFLGFSVSLSLGCWMSVIGADCRITWEWRVEKERREWKSNFRNGNENKIMSRHEINLLLLFKFMAKTRCRVSLARSLLSDEIAIWINFHALFISSTSWWVSIQRF